MELRRLLPETKLLSRLKIKKWTHECHKTEVAKILSADKTHELKEVIEIWLAVKNNKTGDIWNNQVAEYVDDRIVEPLSAKSTSQPLLLRRQ